MEKKRIPGCSDCAPKDLAKTIEQACAFLVNGHAGVRELYHSLASTAEDAADREAFKAEADKHERLARETSQLVLPD